jgi:hypothetical protein
MAQLLRHRLHLLRLQGIEIKSGASWEPWLRKIVEIQKLRNESGYSENEYDQLLDTCLLNALGALDGWDRFPVAALLNLLVYEFSTSTDRYPIIGQQLFDLLLKHQPDTLRAEFLSRFNQSTENGGASPYCSNVKWYAAALYLSGQSDANFQQQLFPNGTPIPDWDKRGIEQDFDEIKVNWTSNRLNTWDSNLDRRITKVEFPPSEGDFGYVDKNQDLVISFAEFYNYKFPSRFQNPK